MFSQYSNPHKGIVFFLCFVLITSGGLLQEIAPGFSICSNDVTVTNSPGSVYPVSPTFCLNKEHASQIGSVLKMSHKTGHPVNIGRYPVLTSTTRYNAVDEKSIDAIRYFSFDIVCACCIATQVCLDKSCTPTAAHF